MLADTMVLLGGRFGMATSRVASMILLAQMMRPDDLGRFAFMITSFIVLTQMTSLGSEPTATILLSQTKGREEDPRSGLFLLVTTLAAASMLALWGVDAVFGSVLFEGVPKSSVLLFGASILPGQWIVLVRGILTGQERFRWVALLTTLQWAGYLMGLVVCVLVDRTDLTAATLAFVAPVWVIGVWGVAMTWPRRWRLPSIGSLRTLVMIGIRTHAAQILVFLQMRLDMIVVRALSSAEQVGYYTIATNATEWMLYLPRALASVILPRASRDELIRTGSFGLQFGLLSVAALTVWGLAPIAIERVFGPAYLGGVAPLRALLIGTVFLGHATLSTSVLMGRRRFRELFTAGGAVVVAFLVFDLAFVPGGGALAAAYVSSALYSMYAIALGWAVFDGSWRTLIWSFVPLYPRSAR